VANRPLDVRGTRLFPDVRFRARRLILEFDGREAHLAAAQFLSDRERWNLLEAAGYHVLRFGWEHLDQPGYVARTVRRAYRHAASAWRLRDSPWISARVARSGRGRPDRVQIGSPGT